MSKSSSGGIGFLGLLTVAFVVLKLIGQIDWSWWWVFSPILIIPTMLLCAVIITILMFTGILNKSFWRKFDKRNK